MHRLLFTAFQRWAESPLTTLYGFGDPVVYGGTNRDGLPQAALNPYIKSEADIQVKFGGYLEAEFLRFPQDLMRDRADLLAGGRRLTVHAELRPCVDSPQWRADLSVHAIPPGTLWTQAQPNPVVQTVRAVVEVKYANYRDPDYLFAEGLPNGVWADLHKLEALQEGVARLLLLLDEGQGVSAQHIKSTVEFAQRNNISILSNNPKLSYQAA